MKPKFTNKQLDAIRDAAMEYDAFTKATPARTELAAFWSQATLDVMARRGDEVCSAELLAAIEGLETNEYVDALVTVCGDVVLALQATPTQKERAVSIARSYALSAKVQLPLEAN